MILEKLSDKVNSARFDVCGVGNAIVDVLAQCEDVFLEAQGITKGAMNLVDEKCSEALFALMKNPVTASGGSVANSMAAIASLGGHPCYMGKVKNDELGRFFSQDMENLGVSSPVKLTEEGAATGRSLIFVTPDAQRSMNTFLGACVDLGVEDISPDYIVNAKITFLEGYLFDPPKAKEAFRYSAKIAHEAGRLVALCLSDTFCVDRHRDDFLNFIKDEVDILIANELELQSLYQVDDFDVAMAKAREHTSIVAGTRGAQGVAVACGNEIIEVPAMNLESVVDTTGAGDMFAGGFLYGLTNAYNLSSSARIGVISATEVLTHYGPRPKVELRNFLKSIGAG